MASSSTTSSSGVDVSAAAEIVSTPTALVTASHTISLDAGALADGYEADLHEFLPFWAAHGIDHDRGGFVCGLTHDGNVVDSSKFTWYQGRGIWVWAFLYNHCGGDAAHLEAAKKAAVFTLQHCAAHAGNRGKGVHAHEGVEGRDGPRAGDGSSVGDVDGDVDFGDLATCEWYLCVTRDGAPMAVEDEGARGAGDPSRSDSSAADRLPGSVDNVGYASLFVAEGLQELSRATGDDRHTLLAIRLLARFIERRSATVIDAPETYFPNYAPGMRTLGHSMICLRIATQLLQHPALDADTGSLREHAASVGAIADDCVAAITTRFWRPDIELCTETLYHDWTRRRPTDAGTDDSSPGGADASDANANDMYCYLGHGIETHWMLLSEAQRLGDDALWWIAATRFRRHVDVAWDRVYGGCFRAVSVDGAVPPTEDKVLWVQQEVLIGTAMLIEDCSARVRGDHGAAADPESDAEVRDLLVWACEWHARVSAYVNASFSLRPHGFPGWLIGGDRVVVYREHDTFGPQKSLKSRKENYHHPRHAALCMLALRRTVGATVHSAAATGAGASGS